MWRSTPHRTVRIVRTGHRKTNMGEDPMTIREEFGVRSASAIGLALVLAMIGGCTSPGSRPNGASPPLDANLLAGTWEMDLSPAQDRSYLKDLVITPSTTSNGTAPLAFTGSVYGGSEFDNGIVAKSGDRVIFSCVSDEAGQLGGPYYWLGSQNSPTTLTGRVQSLTRRFQLDWSARRK